MNSLGPSVNSEHICSDGGDMDVSDDRTAPSKLPRLMPIKPWKNVDVHSLSREDLIARVQHLENSLETYKKSVLSAGHKAKPGKKQASRRHFDFNRYNTRHVALKVAYLGWDYLGKAIV